MSIEVRNITKTFGAFAAVDRVSLHIASGELVALLGPSGSGKTTLLRILAGLEMADEDGGSILFDGEDVARVPVGGRRVGFVFQHYALFRHLSVQDNIAFGLRIRPRRERPPKEAIDERVHELLRLIQLEHLGRRYPHQLSGGQRQRVALARALAIEPRVLLLDEPFGALDAKVRAELRAWLRELHREIHVTTVFVTHDQEEAFEVSDSVVVMNRGRVEQSASPLEIFDEPASPFVLDFLGGVNPMPLAVRDGVLFMGPFRTSLEVGTHVESAELSGGIREFDLKAWSAAADEAALGEVLEFVTRGDRVQLRIRLDEGPEITARFPRRSSLLTGIEIGTRVCVSPTCGHVYWENEHFTVTFGAQDPRQQIARSA